MFVRVQPACLPVGVAEGDLRAVGYLSGLTAHDGAKPAFKGGLGAGGGNMRGELFIIFFLFGGAE